MFEGCGTLVKRASAGVTLLATAAAVHGQAPPTLYVDASAPPGGDGRSWAHAYRDLQDALSRENLFFVSGDIRIAQGVYKPDRGTGDRGASFVIASAITVSLVGGYAGRSAPDPDLRDPVAYATVLSGDLNGDDTADGQNTGDNSFTIVRVVSEVWFVTIDGLVLRGGNASADYKPRGGAISFDGGNRAITIVRNCVFEGNLSREVGGAIDLNGTVEITNCQFRRNRGGHSGTMAGGGAISIVPMYRGFGPPRVSISGCVFEQNNGLHGGAILIGGTIETTLSVERCTFRGNSSDGGGGAIGTGPWAIYGSLKVDSCLFDANWASSGGAISAGIGIGSAQLRQLTCVHNTAPSGAALFVAGSNVQVSNSIFWDGPGQASEIQVGSVAGSVRDCDIQGGAASIMGGPITSDHIVNVDPLFASPSGPDGIPWTWQDNDLHLSLGSPCIDAGPIPDAASSAILDLDGNPFRTDGDMDGVVRIDLGAYEFRGGSLACPGDFDRNGVLTPADVAAFVRAWFDGLTHGCP